MDSACSLHDQIEEFAFGGIFAEHFARVAETPSAA